MNITIATGALGHWANKIADHNFISVVMSQCPEYMAPYGSYEPIFGTNPIAIGLPTEDSPIVLDMATSTCALYHLVTCREEKKELEYNLAYDAQGAITTDPIEGNFIDC